MKLSVHAHFVIIQLTISLLLWWLTGVNALLLWALVLLLLIGFGVWQASYGLNTLELDHSLQSCAFEGQDIDIDLHLKNANKLSIQYLRLNYLFSPSKAHTVRVQMSGKLLSNSKTIIHLKKNCSARWGKHSLGPVVLHNYDALSLCSFRRSLAHQQPRFDLFPEVFLIPEFEQANGTRSFIGLSSTSRQKGQSLLYRGVRDYCSGDEIRSVHWPATARRNILSVKEFEESVQPYFSVFLDLQGQHLAGTGKRSTIDSMVRIASSLLWTSQSLHEIVQLFGSSRDALHIEAGTGHAHLQRALRRLVDLHQDGDQSMHDLVSQHIDRIPFESTVVLVYSTAAMDWQEMAATIQLLQTRRVASYVIQIENHEYISIFSRQAYIENAEQQSQQCHNQLSSRGISHLRVNANDSLQQQLREGSW